MSQYPPRLNMNEELDSFSTAVGLDLLQMPGTSSKNMFGDLKVVYQSTK